MSLVSKLTESGTSCFQQVCLQIVHYLEQLYSRRKHPALRLLLKWLLRWLRSQAVSVCFQGDTLHQPARGNALAYGETLHEATADRQTLKSC